MSKIHPQELREKVLALRVQGMTYAEIQLICPIPKSTLSYWFSNNRLKKSSERQKQHLAHARVLSSKSIANKKAERIEEARRRAEKVFEEINPLSLSVQKSLLAMLYWAEGTKSDRGALVFVNTDPLLISFYSNLLRSAYSLNESKFRVRIHLHDYHSPEGALKYWSNLTKVPLSQFGKIYVKKRSTRKKFRENFQGVCCVVYHDSSLRRELLALGRILAERFRE